MTSKMLLAVVSALAITSEDAKRNCKEIPEINSYYFWSNQRGGKAMIINEAGDRLIASSAVKYEDHIKAFISGKRN